MSKEELKNNTFEKEARPTTGRLKSSQGFGRGVFGTAKFGQGATGYEQSKEALATNSHTKEVLSSKIS